jgi:hypothetical protein
MVENPFIVSVQCFEIMVTVKTMIEVVQFVVIAVIVSQYNGDLGSVSLYHSSSFQTELLG